MRCCFMNTVFEKHPHPQQNAMILLRTREITELKTKTTDRVFD
jgi:hypothetical protein